MPGSAFYIDGKPPFNQNIATATTLTSTMQNPYPLGWSPLLPKFFNYPGKLLYMRSVGICTSGATPGTLSFALYWGTGAGNNGTQLVSSGMAWTASAANEAYILEMWIRCRLTGVSGSLFCYGKLNVTGSGIVHVPAQNPVATTVDLTQNFMLSPQFSRSGSTAETITPYWLYHQALN